MTTKPTKSLSDKLRSLILSTLCVALLVMFSISAVNHVLTYRQGLVDSLTNLARAIGASTVPAILRGDTVLATDLLVAFSADPSVTFAQVTLKGGEIFAEYSVNPNRDSIQTTSEIVGSVLQAPDRESTNTRVAFHPRYVELVVPIISRNKTIGVIALQSNPNRLYRMLFWQLLATIVQYTLAMVIALRVSSHLRHRIEKPVNDLASAMRGVSQQHDFKVRVAKAEDDEIGALADGFNHMLEEIQNRDTELEAYRAQLIKRNSELKSLANRDSLTNCLNRRAFLEELGPVIESARKRGEALSCVMIDIDRFKSVNDLYGHLVGDQVIQMVAQILSEHLRPRDLLCRYGGEEFCLMLPETSLDVACTIAERLREAIETRSATGLATSPGFSFTASFGVASYQADMSGVEDLIRHADRALYSSKQNGRNRVSFYLSALAEAYLKSKPSAGAQASSTPK